MTTLRLFFFFTSLKSSGCSLMRYMISCFLLFPVFLARCWWRTGYTLGGGTERQTCSLLMWKDFTKCWCNFSHRIEHGIEYLYFSRYCIEDRNSSLMTTQISIHACSYTCHHSETVSRFKQHTASSQENYMPYIVWHISALQTDRPFASFTVYLFTYVNALSCITFHTLLCIYCQ